MKCGKRGMQMHSNSEPVANGAEDVNEGLTVLSLAHLVETEWEKGRTILSLGAGKIVSLGQDRFSDE